MFERLVQVMSSGIAGISIINNALLESFGIHLRVLIWFFYAENPHLDDVIAVSKLSYGQSHSSTQLAPNSYHDWLFAVYLRKSKQAFTQITFIVLNHSVFPARKDVQCLVLKMLL